MVAKNRCPNCPHPLHGLHNKKTGRCKLCPCEGPNGKVKGGYVSYGVDFGHKPPSTVVTKFVDDHFEVLHVGDDPPKRKKKEPEPTFGDIGQTLSAEAKRLANKKRKP